MQSSWHEVFLWTGSWRKTSKRMLKPLGGLTPSQVSRWVLLFAVSRVCLSDPGGHVYVRVRLCVWLLIPTTIWLHPQSLCHGGPALATNRTWLPAEAPGINRLVTGGKQKNKRPGVSLLVLSRDIFVVCGCPWKQRDSRLFCTGFKTFCFNLKESCDS